MVQVLNLDKSLLSPTKTQVQDKALKILSEWIHASRRLRGSNLLMVRVPTGVRLRRDSLVYRHEAPRCLLRGRKRSHDESDEFYLLERGTRSATSRRKDQSQRHRIRSLICEVTVNHVMVSPRS